MIPKQLAASKNKQLYAFICFALKEGWQVKLSPKGNIQLKRKGHASIYSAAYLLETKQYTAEKLIQFPTSTATEKGGN
ncbi:hypothetical protein [Orbus mooreae]|uniref:hypothetical protein n=1 Tax=Orbus mooreae TaxID=3074107 RepID=UPI00370D42D7